MDILCDYVEVKDVTEEKRTLPCRTLFSLTESAELHCGSVSEGEGLPASQKKHDAVMLAMVE